MGRRQRTAAAYAKRPASAPSAALPVELASGTTGCAQVHLFFGGRGRPWAFRRQPPATQRSQDTKRCLRRLLPPTSLRRVATLHDTAWPSPVSRAPCRVPTATCEAGSRRPEPTSRGSRHGPTLSEGRWSCVQLGVPGAVCCLRTGSQYSCSASARRLPPSRRMHPRAGGDRSPPQTPGRCRGLAVSHRLD